MKITLLCVGKVKEQFFRNLIGQHEKHLRKKCDFSICQIDDLPISKKAGEARLEKIKVDEGQRILHKIPKEAYVIALCIDGKELTPAAHKKILQTVCQEGSREIIYVIGGSLGLSEEVVDRADYKLSFSKMTFPHQLMRVMLLEVIDRDYL